MAEPIMIQGTMSSAGKSFVAAGLCRVFSQDGFRTAPFKSQNMALNSYVTEDGLEMGRAQVMQAEAAGVRPCVQMNPILLKPTSQMGSQVIVEGRVLGNMDAQEYYRRKREFVPAVKKAYETLAAEYDILVIEGAGSPAEINLAQDDLVNMGMARLATSPVLLVADIDRGGVFASIYGTVKLLPPEEQRYFKGIVINKFRGDQEILKPGLRMIQDLTGIPVLGVIPMERFDLDDEDSLSDRLAQQRRGDGLDFAVIRLPRISNFTDFAMLEGMPGISLRYVGRPQDLGRPDAVLLPGTKNTMGDLKWLRQSGMEASILRLWQEGVPVAGICGGYQMMGESLSDPFGTEEGGSLRGMGILPVETVFSRDKTRRRSRGRVLSPGLLGRREAEPLPVEGYEIHMGESRRTAGEGEAFLLLDGKETEGSGSGAGREDGCIRRDGTAFGTYLHGIFDTPAFAEAFAAFAARSCGKEWRLQERLISRREKKEQEYDRLAALLRRSLPMDRIYQILEEGIC